MDNIGNVIRQERERQGISRYKLSKDLGLSYPTVLKAETGGDTRLRTLQKICDALSIKIVLQATAN